LEVYFGAIDNVVSSHPEIAGIVWGALRFLMRASEIITRSRRGTLTSGYGRACATSRSTLRKCWRSSSRAKTRFRSIRTTQSGLPSSPGSQSPVIIHTYT
ncbi:hypothetical protein BV25DRAFT_1813664, partial [Artomyces pyxidatus]